MRCLSAFPALLAYQRHWKAYLQKEQLQFPL